MSRPNWSALRERYGPVAIALALVLIVPADLRQAVWRWALHGSDVLDVIVAVLVLTNLRSMGEHKSSNRKLDAIDEKLENGIKKGIGRIEKAVGCQCDE